MRTAESNAAASPARVIWADLTASVLSALCLLHCLALPLLAPLAPFAGALLDEEHFHGLLVLLAAPVSLGVLLTTLKAPPTQEKPWLAAAIVAGLSLLLLALAEPFAAHERRLTVFGALLLLLAHLWHWRRAHRRTAGRP